MQTQNKIPMGIMLLGGLLAVVGTLVGLSGILNLHGLMGLDSFAPDYRFDLAANQLASGMFSDRSLVMAGAMALALYLRNPRILAIAFMMRAATELQDTMVILLTGATPTPTRFVMAGVLVVLMLAEIFCIWRLLRIEPLLQPAR